MKNRSRPTKATYPFLLSVATGGTKMEDKTLVCKDCAKEFVFTAGEQEFYKEKGFENDPVRCPECRRAKKAQRNTRER